MIVCAKATLIAASILAMIYSALSFMGASSVAKLGHLDNGGAVLAKVSNYYFRVIRWNYIRYYGYSSMFNY